jgi:hypothetical protein
MMDGERAVLNHLADAWNAFAALPPTHPADRREFEASIHRAQDIVAGRLVRRCYPDVFCTVTAPPDAKPLTGGADDPGDQPPDGYDYLPQWVVDAEGGRFVPNAEVPELIRLLGDATGEDQQEHHDQITCYYSFFYAPSAAAVVWVKPNKRPIPQGEGSTSPARDATYTPVSPSVVVDHHRRDGLVRYRFGWSVEARLIIVWKDR